MAFTAQRSDVPNAEAPAGLPRAVLHPSEQGPGPLGRSGAAQGKFLPLTAPVFAGLAGRAFCPDGGGLARGPGDCAAPAAGAVAVACPSRWARVQRQALRQPPVEQRRCRRAGTGGKTNAMPATRGSPRHGLRRAFPATAFLCRVAWRSGQTPPPPGAHCMVPGRRLLVCLGGVAAGHGPKLPGIPAHRWPPLREGDPPGAMALGLARGARGRGQ